jgi:hypothetical protein
MVFTCIEYDGVTYVPRTLEGEGLVAHFVFAATARRGIEVVA